MEQYVARCSTSAAVTAAPAPLHRQLSSTAALGAGRLVLTDRPLAFAPFTLGWCAACGGLHAGACRAFVLVGDALAEVSRRVAVDPHVWVLTLQWLATACLAESVSPRHDAAPPEPPAEESSAVPMDLLHCLLAGPETADDADLSRALWSTLHPRLQQQITAEGFLLVAQRMGLNCCYYAGGEVEGLVVCPALSMMNHNCAPNCYLDFANEQCLVQVRTSRAVAVGEPLTISYLPRKGHLWPTPQRRAYLHQRWHFTCGCERCASPTDAARLFVCLRCAAPLTADSAAPSAPVGPDPDPDPSDPQPLPGPWTARIATASDPTTPAPTPTPWRCGGCGHAVGEEERRRCRHAEVAAAALLAAASPLPLPHDCQLLPLPAPLSRLHPFHHLVLELVEAALVEVVTAKDLPGVERVLRWIVAGERHHFGHPHPDGASHTYLVPVAVLHLRLGEREVGRRYLRQAIEVWQRLHPLDEATVCGIRAHLQQSWRKRTAPSIPP